MGNKINPIGLRLPKYSNWKFRWYDKKKFFCKIIENEKIITYIKKTFKNLVNDIFIEKVKDCYLVLIYSSKPGLIIGKNGINIKKISSILNNINLQIIVKDIKNSEINTEFISENICIAIKKRENYKKIINLHIKKAMRYAIKGIKIQISGRINGIEISRRETYKNGKISLNKISKKISYSSKNVNTKYGIINIKTWISY
ncbi:30S ribosomal protein S3 [Candidatus Vidania fulgoroideorum]